MTLPLLLQVGGEIQARQDKKVRGSEELMGE